MSVPGRSASGDSAGDRSTVAPNSAAGFVQKAVRIVVGLEQGFDPRAERGVAAGGLVQERGPLGRRLLAGSQEDRLDVVRVGHFSDISLQLHALSMLCDVLRRFVSRNRENF